MICPTCGAEVPENIKFCPACGNRIQTESGTPDPNPVSSEPISQDPFAGVIQEPDFRDPFAAQEQKPAAPVNVQPSYETPSYQGVYQMPAPSAAVRSDADEASASKSILILGIIGLALSAFPFLISIGGIIVSAIGRGKVKNYVLRFGEVHGKAKVGAILSKVGLILSIIMTVCWAIILIAVGILIADGSYHGWGEIMEDLFDIDIY